MEHRPDPAQLEAARRRRAWRERREAMETAPSGRPWRARLRRNGYKAVEIVGPLLHPSRIVQRGTANALDVGLTRLCLIFPHLPPAFDGYRILHLSDLHLDKIDGTADVAAALVAAIKADLGVFTGDVRDDPHGPLEPVLDRLTVILSALRTPDGVYGVLGNHDNADMVCAMEALGKRMLINETVLLRRGDDRIHLTGVDDVHRFATEAAHEAMDAAPEGFGIALVHSPEIADRATSRHSVYLCGHTHGGQICLPGGRPLMVPLRRFRSFARGLWRHGDMIGYTSTGVGASVLPMRFNSRGEVVLITLRRGPGPAAVYEDGCHRA